MIYSMIISHQNSDPKYISSLETWEEVTDYLKEKLDQWVVKVEIYKWSSDNRCLGEKVVTMGNLYSVATSPNDKILI